MDLNKVKVIWPELLENLGKAVCKGCQCQVDLDENGMHIGYLGTKYECTAKNLREYLNDVSPIIVDKHNLENKEHLQVVADLQK